jgi:hypothetical protein
MARPDLDLVGEREQALVEGPVDVRGPLLRLDRQIGAGDVADEQRVAAEEGPGLASPGAVAEQERGVLRAMPWGVQGLDRDLAEDQLPAIGERLMREVDAGHLVNVDHGARGPRQAAVPRDVVRVGMGLENVLDADAVESAEAQVGVDVPLRVDDGGDAGRAVADQVGGAAQVLVDDLAEQHRGRLSCRTCGFQRRPTTPSGPCSSLRPPTIRR